MTVEQQAPAWQQSQPAPPAESDSPSAPIEPFPAPAEEPVDSTAESTVDGSGEAEEDGGLDMRKLVEWVGDNIANLVSRKVPATGGYPRWCTQWWYHAEAIVRFEVLRLAWVDLMGEGGTSKAMYFRDYLDPTLMTLMADDGPFARCTPERHMDSPALGQGDPPAEIFE